MKPPPPLQNNQAHHGGGSILDFIDHIFTEHPPQHKNFRMDPDSLNLRRFQQQHWVVLLIPALQFTLLCSTLRKKKRENIKIEHKYKTDTFKYQLEAFKLWLTNLMFYSIFWKDFGDKFTLKSLILIEIFCLRILLIFDKILSKFQIQKCYNFWTKAIFLVR